MNNSEYLDYVRSLLEAERREARERKRRLRARALKRARRRPSNERALAIVAS